MIRDALQKITPTEVCKKCRRRISDVRTAFPNLLTDQAGEYNGQYKGYLCKSCTPWQIRRYVNDQNAQADSNLPVAAFNYQQFKEAGFHIVIVPQELHPDFLADFQGDEDSLFDFLESLSEHECSIMKQHRDNPDMLRKLRQMVAEDLDETAKDLAME